MIVPLQSEFYGIFPRKKLSNIQLLPLAYINGHSLYTLVDIPHIHLKEKIFEHFL